MTSMKIVQLSMMSGHGANQIQFSLIKKKKIGSQEH